MTDKRADKPGGHGVGADTDRRSYIPAMEDIEFLHGEAARAVRLQLDYLKPQQQMKEHGVEHAVVIFGAARILEAEAAQAELECVERTAARNPDDAALQQQLCIASRVRANSHYYDVAREFATRVGAAGLAVMTGGGPGIMEAANLGAFESGTNSIGLNITLPHEQYPNPYLTPGLCVQFHYFAIRKLHFLLRARALVAFPGGYGTLDELFETLTLIQTGKHPPIPVVLVGRAFWERAVDFDFLVDEGVIAENDTLLFQYAESAADIWRALSDWYRDRGEALFQ